MKLVIFLIAIIFDSDGLSFPFPSFFFLSSPQNISKLIIIIIIVIIM